MSRKPPKGEYTDLQHAIAAYNLLMDEIVPESQYYFLGKRENTEKIRYLGDLVERAAARKREQERGAATKPGAADEVSGETSRRPL